MALAHESFIQMFRLTHCVYLWNHQRRVSLNSLILVQCIVVMIMHGSPENYLCCVCLWLKINVDRPSSLKGIVHTKNNNSFNIYSTHVVENLFFWGTWNENLYTNCFHTSTIYGDLSSSKSFVFHNFILFTPYSKSYEALQKLWSPEI